MIKDTTLYRVCDLCDTVLDNVPLVSWINLKNNLTDDKNDMLQFKIEKDKEKKK
jgi:hypothetical protein